ETLTDEHRAIYAERIANATTVEEVERLSKKIKAGIIPSANYKGGGGHGAKENGHNGTTGAVANVSVGLEEMTIEGSEAKGLSSSEWNGSSQAVGLAMEVEEEEPEPTQPKESDTEKEGDMVEMKEKKEEMEKEGEMEEEEAIAQGEAETGAQGQDVDTEVTAEAMEEEGGKGEEGEAKGVGEPQDVPEEEEKGGGDKEEQEATMEGNEGGGEGEGEGEQKEEAQEPNLSKEEIMNFKVAQLKKELLAIELPTNGLKAELQKRLLVAMGY
ncbi:unnamed protein product, partial [Choristocarpus tenellus]